MVSGNRCSWFFYKSIAGRLLEAFDLINHDILINKLSNTGISPFIVRWVASFIQDRSQRVKVGGEFSEIGFPNGGIPQGTILGPKGFLVHINDLETPLLLYKYVDDCTILEMCKLGCNTQIQQSADILVKWSTDNDMKVNESKTKEWSFAFPEPQTM